MAEKKLYPTLEEKGVRLTFGVIINHPFTEGNKRTEYAAMAAFFKINGIIFEPVQGNLSNTIFNLAASEIDWEIFLRWVKKNCS